ncbi:hypothetical protein HOLleu_36734 [Holothuria leucospilota]|uniref:Uncharacterized protein n=1 Tax=Holothuria leucospilota TaxID=206669 RepID=A0A9Q0YP31_HOLLE|nr:hypothetical protein HOLleu_36734 [Holothuria leucospilota]
MLVPFLLFSVQSIITLPLDEAERSQVSDFLSRSYNRHQHVRFARKERKLRTLAREDPVLKNLTEPERTWDKFGTTSTTNSPNVINLSSQSLTDTGQSILTKGLSFCPTTKLNDIELCQETTLFCRRICLAEWSKDIQSDEHDAAHPPRKRNFLWTPPEGRNKYIDTYVSSVQTHLDNFLCSIRKSEDRPLPENFDRAQRSALKELQKNDNLIIKPADKGGAIVIQDRADYIHEADRQLQDALYYKSLDTDPTSQHIQELRTLLSSFPTQLRQQVEICIPEDPRPGRFYTLPKTKIAYYPSYSQLCT